MFRVMYAFNKKTGFLYKLRLVDQNYHYRVVNNYTKTVVKLSMRGDSGPFIVPKDPENANYYKENFVITRKKGKLKLGHNPIPIPKG
jgi:hypothetical protein